ncbi:L-aspartate oxidase [Desmospora profundinema]|uniref:L-aspartate oxidase n=1 Tax=Desmospora profundinema TaxID=1571184 RepID=A0ABU1IRD9_9BACL|nr:L-aspartate oxidase [Desmospora profundinema]MDR6227360.1 L-aspartate oxidase [Desmospora profundinema]
MNHADFIVVGSGIAGLLTAWELARQGEVAVLTKGRSDAGNTARAQGGIAAAIGEGDSAGLHSRDTIRAGAGLCAQEAVDILVQGGPEAIARLQRLGTPFDHGDAGWALTREGSHSVPRILHARGDATGAAIVDALLQRVSAHPRIQLLDHTTVLDLIIHKGICTGVQVLDQQGTLRVLPARAVVLATGGCGQVYRYTTNHPVVTGDGLAMAHRAGARLMDMEMVQFHPTALAVEQNPMVLVSEAVRGEGARLINDRGDAFMDRVHSWGDLAPRDVVSRAIDREMRKGSRVFLDARHLHSFSTRFPTIDRLCRSHGVDPAREPIPVVPAAHFLMGGVAADTDGQTSIPHLFAVGEVACTGVHGANRLASNSLLEGAVFARRTAVKAAKLPWGGHPVEASSEIPSMCEHEQVRASRKQALQRLMWEHAGIVRDHDLLLKGMKALTRLANETPSSDWECHNMICVSQLILKAALWRKESRGGHYRSDYPEAKAEWAKRRSSNQRGAASESVGIAAIGT